MDIALLVFLILLNGCFAMAEMALVTARKARLAALAESGHTGAATAIALGAEPTRLLSTVQVGITLIGILNGVLGEAALARPMAAVLARAGVEPGLAGSLATAGVVVVLTYATIVVGELVPKRLGQLHPERIASALAQPMSLLASLAHPFVRLLTVSTAGLLRLAGQQPGGGPAITEEEIHAMLDEGSQAGVIEPDEREMVRNVFRLDERLVGSLMVPRADVTWLNLADPAEEQLARMTASTHSRFPVCRGSFDDIAGVIDCKQLFAAHMEGRAIDPDKDLRPPVFVPETLTGMELLAHLRTSGAPLAFVIDEYGETQGLVTLQDVIEAVTGDLQSLESGDDRALQRGDGSWLLDGMLPVIDLQQILALNALPEEVKGRYHTLAGMLMWLMGRVPGTGEIANWEGWRFEVVDVDGKRIDKVLATRLPSLPTDASAPAAGGTPSEPPA